MQRLSHLTEIVLSSKINTRNMILLSFKDSPRKPLRRRHHITKLTETETPETNVDVGGADDDIVEVESINNALWFCGALSFTSAREVAMARIQ